MYQTAGNWRVIGASATGTRHLLQQAACEDAFGYDQSSANAFLIAVADGAGSVAHAKEGALCAIHTAIALARTMLAQQVQPLSEVFCHDLLLALLQAVRAGLEELAHEDQNIDTLPASAPEHPDENDAFYTQEGESTGSLLNAFATTLLLVLVTPEWLAALQLGDGGVVIQQAGGTLETITKPERKEYINQCSFVTDPDYQEHVQCIVLPVSSVQGLAVFTDGIQMLALDLATNAAYAPFFLPLFNFVTHKEARQAELEAELHDFLASPRVCERTDDDKTLLLAVLLQDEKGERRAFSSEK